MLDLVFGDRDEAELFVSVDKRVDDFGKTQVKYSYRVETIDEETGVILAADLKPRQPSDRAKLIVLCDIAKALAKSDETDEVDGSSSDDKV